jgi:hypothetical protein
VYGLSRVLEKEAFRASGGFPGYSANVVYFVEDEVAVVALSNNYSPVTSWIADAAASIYFEKPYNPPAAIRSTGDWSAANDLLGRFSVSTFPPFTITMRNGRPFLSWNPVRVSALVPVAPDTFFEKLDWMTLKIERDEKGQAIGLVATAPWASNPMPVKRLE